MADTPAPAVGGGSRPASSRLGRSELLNIVVSGAGFLSDAYDLFIINIVLLIIRNVHHDIPNRVGAESFVASAALAGGWL
jgi:hypothetical protein